MNDKEWFYRSKGAQVMTSWLREPAMPEPVFELKFILTGDPDRAEEKDER